MFAFLCTENSSDHVKEYAKYKMDIISNHKKNLQGEIEIRSRSIKEF